MKRFDREELAWAAGFFDGEGCVYSSNMNTKRPRKGKTIHFDIAQTDRQVLDRFTNALGIGKVYGPYPGSGKGPNNKDYYRYTLAGFEKCQAAVALIWKNLGSIKRQQASLALETMRKYYSEPRIKPGPKPKIKSI